MDGGFTDSLPVLPVGRTITVSPFAGLQDVCPVHRGLFNTGLRLANMTILVRVRLQLISVQLSDTNALLKSGWFLVDLAVVSGWQITVADFWEVKKLVVFLSFPWRTWNVWTRLCSLLPLAPCTLYMKKVSPTPSSFWREKTWWADVSPRHQTKTTSCTKHAVCSNPFYSDLLCNKDLLMVCWAGLDGEEEPFLLSAQVNTLKT